MPTSTFNIRWRRCCQTQPITVSFDNGVGSARMPSAFLRRSAILRQQMELTKDMSSVLVNMDDIDSNTFWLFFDWSHQQSPEPAYLDMRDALALARLSDRYQIDALRNQLSDLFRDRLGKKSWKIDPTIIQAICDIDDQDEQWLYGMIKVLLGTVTAHFGHSKRESGLWTCVMDQHPDLYRAHFMATIAGSRPQDLFTGDSCRWHQHANGEPETQVSCSASCQSMMQEFLPEWMDLDTTGFNRKSDCVTEVEISAISKRSNDTAPGLHLPKRSKLG